MLSLPNIWDNLLLGHPTVYLLSVIDPAALYLSIQGDAVETYIRANRSFHWAIVRVGLRDRITIPSDAMA